MTRRQREQAAEFASAMATDRVSHPWRTSREIADALGTPGAAEQLAWRAIGRVTWSLPWHEAWALAASMLLNGEIP